MSEPTPDVLIMEMVDLLPLAFPRPLRDAQVIFTPTDDNRRPALVDLKGTADASAPERPDLGYPDEEVLDTLNALVGELAEATRRDGDLFVIDGRIEIRPPDDDGAIEVWLVERVHDGGEDDDIVRMKRRIDKSEQHFFVHTSALFAALNDSEPQEREATARLETLVAGRTGFTVDSAEAAVTFHGGDGDLVKPCQILATWHPASSTFMWGWANEALPLPMRSRVDEVRAAATGFGMRAFAAPELLCPRRMAERLTQKAAVDLGAVGVLTDIRSGPKGDVLVFLGVFD